MSSNPRFLDRVLETSITTGTGTYTLAGAVTGYRSFSVVGNTNSCYYCASDVDSSGTPSGGWEIGIGTYTTSGTTLSRDTILSSSNSGSAVSWSAGVRRVFLIVPADYFQDGAYTSTATGNIDDLDFGSARLIRMNNSSLATIRGLKAARDGHVVTVVSVGAGRVKLAHQNSSSTAANRLINYYTAGDTPVFESVGTASFMYDSSTARWRMIEHDQGNWITPTYSSGNYTANGSMTWTVDSGDVQTFCYFLRGRVLTVSLEIDNTTIGGTANTDLRIAMPDGFVPTKSTQMAGVYFQTAGNGLIRAYYASPNIVITKMPIANWAIESNNTSMAIQLIFPV